jgi:Zn-dependent protease
MLNNFGNAWDLIARIAVLLITLPVHEAAHAFTAVRLGDPTPKAEGRLTLNPFRHLDLFGSAMLLLVGFGWAKPVMVDPRNFRHPRRDMAITAAAGPLSNIALAIVALAAIKLIAYGGAGTGGTLAAVLDILVLVVLINIRLAVFNLLPMPPLDGSRILGFFLPKKLYILMARGERFMMLAVMALLWMGYLSRPIAYLSDKVLALLMLLTSPIDMLFRVL